VSSPFAPVAALILLAGGGAAPSTAAPATAPAANAWACGAGDIPELCTLTKDDQDDRTKQPIDWDVVTVRDRARRAAVIALVRNRPLQTSGDYFHAALVMQHGEKWEDYAAAHILSTRGLQLAPSDQNLQRMVAASWDRMMHSMGHSQWFGTNTFRNPDGTTQPKETRPDLLPDALIDLWSRPWIFPE
jgi:hypothetical protein